jgi:dTDP-4-amino-4,6-dideoxygalactose transaminase
MSTHPFQVVRDFEEALCEYTGARFAVAVNSCTNAIFLALKWHDRQVRGNVITIPKRTYISVPMQVIHAGGKVRFSDEEWTGEYPLRPLKVWDCARRFTSGMYRSGQFLCVSFHISKILGIDQGGAILHDNEAADSWFRRARFDGRSEGVPPRDDHFPMLGWHFYLSPTLAAYGLWRMHYLPMDNPDLPNDDYPDLSQLSIFK